MIDIVSPAIILNPLFNPPERADDASFRDGYTQD